MKRFFAGVCSINNMIRLILSNIIINLSYIKKIPTPNNVLTQKQLKCKTNLPPK